MHREIGDNRDAAIRELVSGKHAHFFDPLGLESDRRIFRSIKEISRSQMIISLLNACVHTLNLNSSTRFLNRIVFHHDPPRKLLELSLYVVNPQMSDRKTYGGMGWVYLVSVRRMDE